MVGDKEVPDKVRAFIGKVESLDEAEKMTNARMNELRTKIDELTHEIKKLSDQLQPYFSKIKQAEKTAVS